MANLDSLVASLICKYKTIYLDFDDCQWKNYLVRSGKWIRLAHPPGPPKKRNFYPKTSLDLPQKPIFSTRKAFCLRLKEPIT